MGGVAAFHRLVILAVDDDEDFLQLLCETLRGHEVVQASGGLEAEAIVVQRGGTLDAVVTDYRMPGRNGVEVLLAAGRHAPRAVRVLLTACPPPETNNLITTGVIHACLLKTSLNALGRLLETLVVSHSVGNRAALPA